MLDDLIEKVENNMDSTMRINSDEVMKNPDGEEIGIDKVMQKKESEDNFESIEDKSKIENQENSKKNKKKKVTKKIKIAILSIIVLFALLGVVFGVYIYKADGNIAEAVLNVASDVLGDQDPIFVLVLGISEDITSKLTDTIILCGYNPDSQKAFMLSIPRDTFIGTNEATAGGYDKINALYQKDVMKTVKAVEKLTGVNINNYVIVRNTALPAIVNAIGEVEFDVPIDMDYDDPTQDLHIHLKAGLQKIDGDKAEQLLRFRHNNNGSSYSFEYGDNDYGRMRTQRNFIQAVAKKLISFDSVSNLKQITSAVFDNLETNMTLGSVLGYVPHVLKFNPENVRAEQLPGTSAMLNELSFYKANSAKSKTLMDELIASLEMTDKENSKYYTRTIVKTNSSSTTNTTNTVKSDKQEANETKNTEKIENEEENKKVNNTHEHDYSRQLSREEPTCDESGSVTMQCSCGDTKTEKLSAMGHNFSGGVCTRCKAKDPNYTKHEHNYSKEISREDSTCSKAGNVTKQCSCGDTKTENLPTKAHNYLGGACTVCGAKDPNYKTEEKPKDPEPEPKPDPDPEPIPDPEPEQKTDETQQSSNDI